MPTRKALPFADDAAVMAKNNSGLAEVQSFLPTDGSPIVLPERQELFLRYYIQNSATRGNGAMSYNMAYGKGLENHEKGSDKYNRIHAVCRVEASKLLTRPNVNARRIQLGTQMLRDEVVDFELSKVVTQDEERGHKLGAIREYNRMKGRVVEKKDIRMQSAGIVQHLYDAADGASEYDYDMESEDGQ